MQKLAKREEQIMHAVWQLGHAFIKEIITEMPDPKPHEAIGNVFRYFPVISKDMYQRHTMNDIVSQYFDNSYPNMLMFFAKEQKISDTELNEIVNLIKSQKK